MLKRLWTALRRGGEVLERHDITVRDGLGGVRTGPTHRTGPVMQLSPQEPDPEQNSSGRITGIG